MYAYGYKRTFTHTVIYVRFTPESGHSEPGFGMSENRLLADVVVCTANDEAKAIWTTANPVAEWRMGNKKLKIKFLVGRAQGLLVLIVTWTGNRLRAIVDPA